MGKKVILFLIVFLISFFLSEIVLMQRKYTIVNGAKSLRLINGCEMVFVNWCSMISGFSWFIQWCWIALERTASGCGRCVFSGGSVATCSGSAGFVCFVSGGRRACRGTREVSLWLRSKLAHTKNRKR